MSEGTTLEADTLERMVAAVRRQPDEPVEPLLPEIPEEVRIQMAIADRVRVYLWPAQLHRSV